MKATKKATQKTTTKTAAPTPTPSLDRRVAKTMTALREALVTLILERGWDDVTVQDVCDRADVGRSTFYTHFADREDLLLSGFNDLKRALRGARALGDQNRVLRFSRALLLHAADNRRLFRALVGKRSGHAVVRRFRELVLDLTTEELPTRLSGVERTMTAHFLAGGFLELMTWWLDARTVDVDDVEAAVQRLAHRILAAS
ncbi:MAG: TetR/AcrR family transcriptional regulator [Deltaproteobacteria bacterium]|nr:TetR/AcrR family transcriptional regulator [Deltaproteobacteria bacterium]